MAKEMITNNSSMSRKLAIITKIGLHLTMLTPLVIGAVSFSFSDYPKVFYFRTLVTICFFLYLCLLWLERKKYTPKFWNPLVISIFVLWFVMLIATLNSFNVGRSFWASLEHVFGLVTYSYYFLFFWLLISLYKDIKDWIWMLRGAVAVGVVTGIAAIGQRMGLVKLFNVEQTRVAGTLSNPDYYSAYLILVIGLGILLLYLERERWLRWTWVILTVFNGFILILTHSRGSWVALAVGAIVFGVLKGYFTLRGKPRLRKKVLLGVLVGCVCLFVINLAILNNRTLSNHFVFSRIYSVFDVTRALGSRLGAWETAVQAFKERPILGWGVLSSGYTFDKFVNPEFFSLVSTNLVYYHPHNAILEVMADMGIIGLLSYLAMFAIAIWLILKKQPKNTGLVLVALLVAYLVQGITLFDIPSGYLLFMIILGLIYFEVADQSKNSCPFIRLRNLFNYIPRVVLGGITILIVVITSVIWYRSNLEALMATQYFVKGIKYENTNFMKSFSLYKEGIRQKTVYSKHLRYGLIARALAAFEGNNKTMNKNEVIDQLSALKLSLQIESRMPDISPVTPYDLLAKIYEQEYLFNKDPEALKNMEMVAEEALANYNQRPHFYNLVGRAYIYGGKWEEGEEHLKKAAEMGPETYLIDMIAFHRNTGLVYYVGGFLPQAVEHFSQAVDLIFIKHRLNPPTGLVNPRDSYQDALFYKNLASLYYQSNDTQAARDVINKALQIFPEHQTWLKRIVAELDNQENKDQAKEEELENQ